MEVKAVARYMRMSPYKGRIVADAIRGRAASEALGILSFTPRKAAVILKKLLNSAIANATVRESAHGACFLAFAASFDA